MVVVVVAVAVVVVVVVVVVMLPVSGDVDAGECSEMWSASEGWETRGRELSLSVFWWDRVGGGCLLMMLM